MGSYMIIILDGKGINKGWIGYIKFGEAIEKRVHEGFVGA